MAKSRNSAVDRSFMDKVYRPIGGYVSNVIKEGAQAAKAFSQSLDATDKAKNYPPSKRPALNQAATAAGKKAEAERGQFLGSLIGNRYDNAGKRITGETQPYKKLKSDPLTKIKGAKKATKK